VLSFVGFVPADEPKLVMLVMLDEPKNEKWGSEAAAPIFSAIGGEVLRYLDVAPRDAAPLHIVTGPAEGPPARVRLSAAAAEPVADRTMPELRGRTLREALTVLAPLGAAVKVQGRGLVKDQTPAPGETVQSEAVVRLTLAGAAAR
jgi:cell division protein FtsI (penicillin-binding protein 3)